VVNGRPQRLQCRRIIQRIEPRSFAFDKTHALTQRMRHDQNIGKQDRSVKPETTDRLQGNLGRSFGIEAEIEKTCGLLAQSPVFGKISPGLPHQPKRRNRLTLSCKNAEQWFAHNRSRHALTLNQIILENLVVVLGRLIGLIQLSAHVIHARPTYSHSRRVDETVVEGPHLWGFIPEIGGLFQSCPHFTDAKPLPGLAIPEGPNVDGRRGFPTIVLASPIQAWPSPQSSTGCPVS
jgi:hypothetical protein